MSRNPYKDYYRAMSRDDEWSGVDAAEAMERIKELEEAASWNGCSVESYLDEPWDGMGS